ncbi:hypothetical protein PRZ48_009996 [Zasmidium cellare]|uniref:DUF7730 domain-containing protein n=1 Tax=Zasmidium cellare TaxID=395010 RepID=A0ABR0EDX2_ZASCE|nr:hypothetical protein PRZ48_009996 [Zasmidium cellare]
MVSARRTRIHKPKYNPLKKDSKSAVAKHALRQRNEKTRRQHAFLEWRAQHVLFKVAVPESTCECCESTSTPAEDPNEMKFDDNGYPIMKKNFRGIFANPLAHPAGPDPEPYDIPAKSTPEDKDEAEKKPFRFLDLPAELRNRIYEIALRRETQPVCVNDNLLRPSTDMPDLGNVLQCCTCNYICTPCQLHEALGTGSMALASACKQLHAETLPITYKMNQFSLHNLYYLMAFLSIIGDAGRKCVKSLRFDWKLPEDESHALETFVSHAKAYMLLLQCKQLTTLWIDLDVVNLLSYRGDGQRYRVMKRDMSETKAIGLMYSLRGLEEIRVRWRHVEGLVMEDWVKAMMGVWRLPRETDGSLAVPVEAEMTMDKKKEWCSVFWKKKAGGEESSLGRDIPIAL